MAKEVWADWDVSLTFDAHIRFFFCLAASSSDHCVVVINVNLNYDPDLAAAVAAAAVC